MSSQRRKELKRAYKEQPRPAGVFQIENRVNGKRLLGSSANLDGALNRHRFMLSNGAHRNAALQADWNLHGADAFVLEILEAIEPTGDPSFNLDEELTLLEEIWIEKLEPFGDQSYNRSRRIRDA